jgi:hypothetical protein
MIPKTSMRRSLDDPNLLGNCLPGPSWKPWRTFLIGCMGEPLDDAERAIWKAITGREREPEHRCEEVIGIVGRRGGKSRATATLAGYIAGCCDHPALVPGERGQVMCVAADTEQAGVLLNYIEATFRTSPLLRQLVETRTQRMIKLTNRVDIAVRASDYRRVRGVTLVAGIGDEVAFWPTSADSASPDTEIVGAMRPALATTAGPLILISSPYARRGELWKLHAKHYGPKGDPAIVIAQAPTWTMNPSLPRTVTDRAYQRDPVAAAAEYGAEFRRDIEAFVSLEAVQSCTTVGTRERAPARGIQYHGFVDPSGGSADAMTLCIGHADHRKQTLVIDLLRERTPPFSPEAVVEEFAAVLKSYRIVRVKGDRYAGEWPREQFGRFSISYDAAVPNKSQLYTDMLALLNSGRIELLDHPKANAQIVGLERRTSRGGGLDRIDHPPNAHDDLANCIAGLSNIAMGSSYDLSSWASDRNNAAADLATERARRNFHERWGKHAAPPKVPWDIREMYEQVDRAGPVAPPQSLEDALVAFAKPQGAERAP